MLYRHPSGFDSASLVDQSANGVAILPLTFSIPLAAAEILLAALIFTARLVTAWFDL